MIASVASSGMNTECLHIRFKIEKKTFSLIVASPTAGACTNYRIDPMCGHPQQRPYGGQLSLDDRPPTRPTQQRPTTAPLPTRATQRLPMGNITMDFGNKPIKSFAFPIVINTALDY
jgi:hypothetical protein